MEKLNNVVIHAIIMRIDDFLATKRTQKHHKSIMEVVIAYTLYSKFSKAIF